MNMNDFISRRKAVLALLKEAHKEGAYGYLDGKQAEDVIMALPAEQPERLTDDDFETVRIHLSAFKEQLCNQHRWKEAEEYQRIIDRFTAFATAQPTIYGYKIEHLAMIASVLQKEDLPPERVAEALKDIGRIVAIVTNEFEETLRKAAEQCTI